MKTEPKMQVEDITFGHLPAVMGIEADSFEFPWCEEDFSRYRRMRNCMGKVIKYDGRAVGYMYYTLHKKRIHLLNFAVSRVFRRLGVGTRLLENLLMKLSAQRRSRIILEVRESNLAAQLFFRENGFRAVAVLRDYYVVSPEDAYLMQYRYHDKKVRSPKHRPQTKKAG